MGSSLRADGGPLLRAGAGLLLALFLPSVSSVSLLLFVLLLPALLSPFVGGGPLHDQSGYEQEAARLFVFRNYKCLSY